MPGMSFDHALGSLSHDAGEGEKVRQWESLYAYLFGCSSGVGVEALALLVAVIWTRVPLIRAALPDSSRR